MKNLKFALTATALFFATSANAEVIEKDYYLKDGKRIYTNSDTSKAPTVTNAVPTLENSFEPAAGVESLNVTVAPIVIKQGEYKALEDKGGDYNANADVYKPDLEFAE